MLIGRRKTLAGICEGMEDQSNALEHEKRKLAHKIDKCNRKEKVLTRIINRQQTALGRKDTFNLSVQIKFWSFYSNFPKLV